MLPNSDISYRVYDQLVEIPLNEEAWDRLVETSNTGGIFLQYFWIRSWWRHFGDSYELFFVTAETDGEVLAFAPLMIDETRTLRFIGDLNSDYLGFAVPPGRNDLLSGLLGFVNRFRHLWSVVHLRNIPHETVVSNNLVDICREEKLIAWNNYSVAAPYLQVDGNADGVSALLGKYSLRRAERILKDQGNLAFEIFSTDERAAYFWEVFAEQHIARCRHNDRSSTFSDPRYLAFLRNIFESDTAKSRVHFSGLFLDDVPIAFHYGFVSQQRLLWYKPSIDISIQKGSPGVVLIQNLIRFAQENHISELDFTIGDESFKNRFCSRRRLVDEFRLHKSRTAYIADSGYWRIRRLLKQLVKSDE